MLSRVAEAIYWMTRYVERAENIARFVDVNLHLTLDLPVALADQWQPLIATTGDGGLFVERYGTATQESVIRFLTFDADYSSSILSCLRAARENARSVREIISSEMWEQVNKLYLRVTTAAASAEILQSPHEFFNEVKLGSQLLTGVTDATLSHGEGWQFARLGRLMERSDKTSRILDVKSFILLPRAESAGSTFDNIQWAAVLKSASALEMYRKRFHRIAPDQVAAFLVLDRDFPRAIRYCLIRAESCLRGITGSSDGTYDNPAERRVARLRAEFDFTEPGELFATGLHAFLDRFQASLNGVGEAIQGSFFR